MRDGSDPEGPALIFTPEEWRAFTARASTAVKVDLG